MSTKKGLERTDRGEASSQAAGGGRRSGAVAKQPKRASSVVRKTITFRLHAPGAQTVDVAGTFTNWTLKPMKRSKNGTWTATFRPQPGTHEYKFLVNHRWMEDPDNHEKVGDGHGGHNSVRRVD